jgi:hypothetical protein
MRPIALFIAIASVRLPSPAVGMPSVAARPYSRIALSVGVSSSGASRSRTVKRAARQQMIGTVHQRGTEMTEHRSTISRAMNLDLTDDETTALAQLLRRTIDEYRYPLSPRLAPLKAILAKLDRRSRSFRRR